MKVVLAINCLFWSVQLLTYLEKDELLQNVRLFVYWEAWKTKIVTYILLGKQKFFWFVNSV